MGDLAVLDIGRAADLAHASRNPENPEAAALLGLLRDRKLALEPEMARFTMLCDRWDNLYYPQTFTTGGASHWANHKSARMAGRTHVSLNVYPTYVEVPAALQSVPPIENMIAGETSDQARALAAMVERLYFAWKNELNFELLGHQACIVKGLYGRTAGKVYWDEETNHPRVEIVENPRNLWLGWRDSNYKKLEWALYTYRITPSTAMEDWGLQVNQATDAEGKPYPIVVWPTGDWSISSLADNQLQVEVYDYWYRRPKPGAQLVFGKPTKFETWNAIFVGNVLVKNMPHREYGGDLPYVPLFNTFLPGTPDGRPDFYDIEHIIREKDERISENSQMMSRAVNGQYWQLTGAEAPEAGPSNLKPVPNGVISPGPGNRLEALQPWMPEFQFEQFLTRLDRELVDTSGMNDLLRGMAPSQVLSSGKAISALVANYETRIRMRREMYYDWRIAVWNLAARVWGYKNAKLKPLLIGVARLDLKAPSLTPRDDAETATISGNLKELKIWSSKRAMDATGVDDPETEENIIRSEQTDATLNPAQVQVMVALMQMLQQMQQQQPQGVADAGQQITQSVQQGMNSMRQTGPDVTGQQSMNGAGEQPVTPADQQPPGAPGSPVAPAEAPPGAAMPSRTQAQFQIKGGEATSRIIGKSTIQQNGQQSPGGLIHGPHRPVRATPEVGP